MESFLSLTRKTKGKAWNEAAPGNEGRGEGTWVKAFSAAGAYL